jgi:hypothetical protein
MKWSPKFGPGGAPSLIAEGLSLMGLKAIEDRMTLKLTAYRAVLDTKLSRDLSLDHADNPLGMNLVSLGLDKLTISYALLHFGR